MGNAEFVKPTKVEKPWGYELIFASTKYYLGKLLIVRKGEKLSLQYHQIKEETLFLRKGEALLTVELNGELKKIVIHSGEACHIPPRTKHRIEAIEDCEFFEVSTPHPDDVVRLEDLYGRV